MDKIIKSQFTNDKLTHVIWRHSFPMFSAILALFAYDLLESSLVALSGAHSLASLGYTLPITAAMTALSIGISIKSNNQVVKHACLAPEKLANIIINLIASAAVAIFLFSLIAMFTGNSLLSMLGNNALSIVTDPWFEQDVVTQQNNYMAIRYVTWIFLMLVWQGNAILRALGQVRTASIIMISWLAVKALIAIILLTPESTWYQGGIIGLGYTHAISDSLFALISLLAIASKIKPETSVITKESFQLRIPSADTFIIMFQQIITPLSMAVLTVIAAKMGNSYVAAFALIFRLEALLLLMPMVLTTSLPTIIGTNFWSGHHDRVKQAYIIVFAAITAFQLILALTLCFNNDFFATFICPQDGVINHIKDYLIWVPWGYFGAGCVIVYQSCLNAEGKALKAATVAFTHRILLLLPLTLLGVVINEKSSFFQGIMLGHMLAGFYVFYLLMSKYNTNHHTYHQTQKQHQTLALNEEKE